jgi:hypothetical protein
MRHCPGWPSFMTQCVEVFFYSYERRKWRLCRDICSWYSDDDFGELLDLREHGLVFLFAVLYVLVKAAEYNIRLPYASLRSFSASVGNAAGSMWNVRGQESTNILSVSASQNRNHDIGNINKIPAVDRLYCLRCPWDPPVPFDWVWIWFLLRSSSPERISCEVSCALSVFLLQYTLWLLFVWRIRNKLSNCGNVTMQWKYPEAEYTVSGFWWLQWTYCQCQYFGSSTGCNCTLQ